MSSSTNQNDSTSQRVDKRVRYFPGQSLGAEDYQAEQTYHKDRQRSHGRWLHAAGICEGLTVTFDKDNSRLTVTVWPGTAVDRQGRQIVLAQKRQEAGLPDQGTVRVYVSYNEQQSDQAGPGENEGHNMRWHESPDIKVVEAGGKPEGTDPILLAEVDIDEGQVDHSVRRYVGLRLPGGETGGQAVTLRATPSGQAELSNDLSVRGKVKEGGNDLVPQGVIVMWSGDIASIPPGWALCNGETYPTSSGGSVTTPDLQGRFAVGIGKASGPGAGETSYSMGSCGGEETHALEPTETPDWSHTHVYKDRRGNLGTAHGGTGAKYSNIEGGYSDETRTTDPAGGAGAMTKPHENRPPYYALAYIMKL